MSSQTDLWKYAVNLEELKENESPTLLILRGKSGSGKTTLATWFRENHDYEIFAADDHFYHNGQYRFVPNQLPAAHAKCLSKTRYALNCGFSVVVHNTFQKLDHLQPYLELENKAENKIEIKIWKLTSEYSPNKNIPAHVIANYSKGYEAHKLERSVTFNKEKGDVVFY